MLMKLESRQVKYDPVVEVGYAEWSRSNLSTGRGVFISHIR